MRIKGNKNAEQLARAVKNELLQLGELPNAARSAVAAILEKEAAEAAAAAAAKAKPKKRVTKKGKK